MRTGSKERLLKRTEKGKESQFQRSFVHTVQLSSVQSRAIEFGAVQFVDFKAVFPSRAI